MPRKKKKTPQAAAVERYLKANTISVNLRLNKKTDTDIIIKLNEVPSKMGYIKGLIRTDIATNGFKNDDE